MPVHSGFVHYKHYICLAKTAKRKVCSFVFPCSLFCFAFAFLFKYYFCFFVCILVCSSFLFLFFLFFLYKLCLVFFFSCTGLHVDCKKMMMIKKIISLGVSHRDVFSSGVYHMVEYHNRNFM